MIQVDKLKEALLKLRNISLAEKQELEKRLHEQEKKAEGLHTLEGPPRHTTAPRWPSALHSRAPQKRWRSWKSS